MFKHHKTQTHICSSKPQPRDSNKTTTQKIEIKTIQQVKRGNKYTQATHCSNLFLCFLQEVFFKLPECSGGTFSKNNLKMFYDMILKMLQMKTSFRMILKY